MRGWHPLELVFLRFARDHLSHAAMNGHTFFIILLDAAPYIVP
jgi:hypothetical protein